MPTLRVTLIHRLLALSTALALLGCQPPQSSSPEPVQVEVPEPVVEAEPLPLPEPEFASDRTYAVLEVGPTDPNWIYALCDVTVLRRYRLRYNRQNWPTCSSRELLIGVGRADEATSGLAAELGDGRRVLIWEIFDLAAGDGSAPLKGRYALAALSREQDTIEVLTGRVPVYRINPGRVHFLGRAGPDGAIIARDVSSFSKAFRARFPELDRRRVDTSQLEGLAVTCKLGPGSTNERITGFDCLGKRLRGRFFR